MGEVVLVSNGCGDGGERKAEERQQQQQQQQGQVLELLLAALRKSVVLPCQMADADDPAAAWGMEIGWPTDVRHVAHVTFDRLQGSSASPSSSSSRSPAKCPAPARAFSGFCRSRCSAATTKTGTQSPRSCCSCKRGCTRKMASRTYCAEIAHNGASTSA